jgi:EmrB/QacA subfamily drug resistance transporter
MTAHGAALPRAGRASDRLDRSTLVVSSVVITGAIMSILDTTIVNVALEALSRDLGATLTTIQWVSTGYLLSLAMVIPLAGWTSERFGAKRVWMTSVALFAVGSALCGLASSAGTLIFFRILQGLGGGLIMPVGMSVLAQRAGPQRMGRVMSVMGIPMLLGPVLGPVLGGLIVSSASWRWIFYVNVPIAVVALVLAARLLPRGVGRGDAGKLDLVGVALLSPGLAGIVFGLSEIESQGGIGSALTLGPILAGALLVGLFARHALVADRPLIDVGLFRDRSFAAAAGLVFLMGAAVFGAMLIIPLYYQEARGQDALAAGLLMAPQGIGAALVMPISGRLVDRIGGGRVVLVGTVVMTLATLPFALLAPGTPTLLLHALLFVRGIGLLSAAGRPAGDPRHRPRLDDDAVDGRRLRGAAPRAGSKGHRRDQRDPADRRLGGHCGAGRGARAPDASFARRRGGHLGVCAHVRVGGRHHARRGACRCAADLVRAQRSSASEGRRTASGAGPGSSARPMTPRA